eukprot:3552586-Lingulodinium_polyedra.AAC.1
MPGCYHHAHQALFTTSTDIIMFIFCATAIVFIGVAASVIKRVSVRVSHSIASANATVPFAIIIIIILPSS